MYMDIFLIQLCDLYVPIKSNVIAIYISMYWNKNYETWITNNPWTYSK